MSPRKRTVDAAKGVLEIDWPFFGELSRGLALKVARSYDPEIVVGIATAGVIPGAVIAASEGRGPWPHNVFAMYWPRATARSFAAA